ncbi:Solute carrier family 22 member 21 [Holothuria leucospilota]|uniref:Solute carrier family 22 member 21 n=1 Tax=Holothuria leucospilota TaxID=206669 RepID=A0A9Q1BTR7_HOLLE|nr:Solute carrier family 22 member 21 [Holothuria leucospilota]
MDIDEALEAVNPLGRAQMLTIFVVILANFQISFLILSVTFNAEIPPHHCALQNGRTLNESIPISDDHYFSSCKEFVNQTVSAETQACSKGWEYDTVLTGKSITSEWNLVCSQDILRDLSQTILFCGFSLGSLIAGPIADKYGRKRPTLCFLALFNIAGIALAFSPNYATFVSLRFLMGLSWKGVQVPLFTLLFENLLPRHRPTVGIIPLPVFSLGLVAMSGIAYLVRDWREFSLIMMTPSVLMMFLSWLLPESIRWLSSRGKLEKTKSALLMMAKFNKVDSPQFSLTDKSTKIPIDNSTQGVTRNQSPKVNDDSVLQEDKGSDKGQSIVLLQLFKKPTRTVTIILCWLWVSYTLGYFGFALTTGTLAGDPYVNFIFSALVELPARILPILVVKKTGNLLVMLCSFGSSGCVMIGVIILRFIIYESGDHGLEWLLTTLALLGKFFATFVFVSLFLCTTELFPTTVRNSGTGFVQLIGNFGSLSSPLLIYLDKTVYNLPFIIMASFALVAAFLCLFLPETLNMTQPETPADLQKLFETKLFLKNIKRTIQSKGGDRKSDDSEMTAKTKEGAPSRGNDNLGYEP